MNIKSLVDAASFAWFSYGMMSMTNLIYYTNKFYWEYIIRQDTGIIAFRTWWGMSEYIRVFANFTTWGLTLFFWTATFFPFAMTHTIFAYYATGLLYTHFLRLFSILIMKSLAFFLDSYETEY